MPDRKLTSLEESNIGYRKFALDIIASESDPPSLHDVAFLELIGYMSFQFETLVLFSKLFVKAGLITKKQAIEILKKIELPCGLDSLTSEDL